MPLEKTILYRGLLRELRLSVRNLFHVNELLSKFKLDMQTSTPRKINNDIKTHFRSLVKLCRHDKAKRDLENAILFLKSQREHKVLIKLLPCEYVSDFSILILY